MRQHSPHDSTRLFAVSTRRSNANALLTLGFEDSKTRSFYGTIRVPSEATVSGAPIVIRVSNYGVLAVYDLDLFGAYDAAEREVLLDGSDRSRVEAALLETRHDVVPTDLLWNTYDGTNDYWQRHFPNERPPTWFTRFFDWV